MPERDRQDAEALIAARWECADLLSRKSPDAARELLLGHAAELACSPASRDQVLSKALEAGAADIAAGRPPLETAVPAAEPPAGRIAATPARSARRRQRWRLIGWAFALGLLVAGATSLAFIDA